MNPSLVLALVFLLAQEPAAPEAAPGPETAPAPIALDRALSYDELVAGCERLRDQDPARVRLETLATTRGGRAVPLLRIGDDGGAALLVVHLAELDRERASAGTEAVLALAARHLATRRSTSPAERLRGARTILLVPALDADALPDAAGERPGARDVRLDRNFPVGWRPDRVVGGSGRRPLSEPESAALMGLLAESDDVALAVVLGTRWSDGGGGPDAGSWAMGAGDERALTRLAGVNGPRSPFRPLSRRVLPAGGIAGCAYELRGTFAMTAALAPAPEDRAAFEARVASLADALARLADVLPSLSIADPAIERLGERLWQVDLRLANHGALPTLSEIGRRRRVSGAPLLAVDGARLLALAELDGAAAGASSTLVGEDERAVRLGEIPGGESRSIRLVVEADAAATFEVSVSAPRAGRVARAVSLAD